jgi:hypothetical protein
MSPRNDKKPKNNHCVVSARPNIKEVVELIIRFFQHVCQDSMHGDMHIATIGFVIEGDDQRRVYA